MKRLSVAQVILMHAQLILQTGGMQGIRDMNLLESAMYGPYQSFGGEELHPTLIEKFSRIGFSIITNHPFVDGNKRIGLLVMLTDLELNGICLHLTDDELVSLGLGSASGEKGYDELLRWVKERL